MSAYAVRQFTIFSFYVYWFSTLLSNNVRSKWKRLKFVCTLHSEVHSLKRRNERFRLRGHWFILYEATKQALDQCQIGWLKTLLWMEFIRPRDWCETSTTSADCSPDHGPLLLKYLFWLGFLDSFRISADGNGDRKYQIFIVLIALPPRLAKEDIESSWMVFFFIYFYRELYSILSFL